MESESGFSQEQEQQEEALRAKFPIGGDIKIRRSSGVIEEGWNVLSYARNKNEVLCAIVYKSNEDETLRKKVALSELAEYN